jgi:hypothetical protein
MPYVKDTIGSKSYFAPEYCETMSVLSREPLLDVTEILHINPRWEVKMPNGYLAKSYDSYYQLVETIYGKVINVHFLPEKFFKKDFLLADGKRYIDDNLHLLQGIANPAYFCGDLNTRNITQVFETFFKDYQLINAFKDTPTRPVSAIEAVPQDVICYSKDRELVNKGVLKTENDHYLIWAEFQ